MSRIRGKNTAPEMRVRSLLHRLGYRFRLHVRIPITLSASTGETPPSPHPMGREAGGEVKRCRAVRFVRPDVVLAKYKTAVFIHGCFWHRHEGCKNCTTPTNRREWWVAKLNGNAARDKLHQAALKKLGWRVIVIWECEAECEKCERILRRQLLRRTRTQATEFLERIPAVRQKSRDQT